MLRHIVMWNYKEGLSDSQNQENAKKLKAELEALKDSIQEVMEIKVHINSLPSSNMDIMLDSLFENEEALEIYKKHPEHVKIAEFVGSVLQNRACIDYFE